MIFQIEIKRNCYVKQTVKLLFYRSFIKGRRKTHYCIEIQFTACAKPRLIFRWTLFCPHFIHKCSKYSDVQKLLGLVLLTVLIK